MKHTLTQSMMFKFHHRASLKNYDLFRAKFDWTADFDQGIIKPTLFEWVLQVASYGGSVGVPSFREIADSECKI